jgi:putative polyhydroxyalkanoate system protein
MAIQRAPHAWLRAGAHRFDEENALSEIHIQRAHALGLLPARKIARHWAERAVDKFGMECTYEETESGDLLHFTRSGVDGALRVASDGFEMTAKLGFLLSAFKDRIETEIARNMDAMALGQDDFDAPAAADAPSAAPAPTATLPASVSGSLS